MGVIQTRSFKGIGRYGESGFVIEILEKLEYDKYEEKTDYSEELRILQIICERGWHKKVWSYIRAIKYLQGREDLYRKPWNLVWSIGNYGLMVLQGRYNKALVFTDNLEDGARNR